MTNSTSRSIQLFERAQRCIPGGVNSPVRAFRGVGGTPVFIRSAQGSRLTDVDGRTYIDYVGSWGPMILGHAHPEVIEAVTKTAARGTSYGAPTELEIELAEEIIKAVPSIDKIRLVSSGTEAVMSAIRLARGFTGRDKIIKFIGCYHGHADSLLVKAGSGVATLGLPDSPGVPADFVKHTIALPYNDEQAVAEAFARCKDEIACLVVEPVAGNMGCVPPQPGYLQELRRLTQENGALLIFDEVMTGFRVSRGGAQALYGIAPDLTTLGKIIGGGLPVGAFGGKAEIMDHVAPAGSVYQAGTLSGNPLAVVAGLTQLQILSREPVYARLEEATLRLITGITDGARDLGVPLRANRVASMFTGFFTEEPVTDWDSAKKSDTQLFGRFFHAMLAEGVYLAPSQFEAAFVSYAHSDEDIEATISAAERSLKKCIETKAGV